MSNELCKCGKVGEISCPHDDRCGSPMSNTDNTLPDLKQRLQDASYQYGDDFDRTYTVIDLEKVFKVINGYNSEYAQKYEQATDLLKRWVRIHDMAMIPSGQLINEIKSFLDGSK